MEYYLIFIAAMVFFSFLGLNLFSALALTVAAYSLLSGFGWDQISFLLFNNAMNLKDKSEIMAIPFLLASSEMLVNYGYFDKLKRFLFKNPKVRFAPFFIFFIFSSIPVGSSLIYHRLLNESFSNEEFKENRNGYMRINFMLSALSFIMPVSIPMIIAASLLNISLKVTILYTLILSLIVFTLYYFIVINKYFSPLCSQSEKKTTVIDILPVITFAVMFFYLIYAVSFPANLTAEVLFFTTFIIVFLQNKSDFIPKLLTSIRNAVFRSGVLISLVYLIGIINFFHIYAGASEELFDFLLFSFTNNSYLIISIFILAFLLLELIDPLGIILILHPIYYSLLDTYNISQIIFILSFAFFVSLGLMSNISGLPGNIYRNKYGLKSADIYQVLLPEYLIIVITSFGILGLRGLL